VSLVWAKLAVPRNSMDSAIITIRFMT
jgi:hypothetical protein